MRIFVSVDVFACAEKGVTIKATASTDAISFFMMDSKKLMLVLSYSLEEKSIEEVSFRRDPGDPA